MLQQTQVDRVLPKYQEWLDRYPSLAALAAAPEADVVKTWYPLGYNIRPRRLQAIARESVEKIQRGAAGRRGHAAIVQGDRRVYGRRGDELRLRQARRHPGHERGAGPVPRLRRPRRPRLGAMEKHLWEISRAVLPHRHVFDFNQALMDFGATLCNARKPQCMMCPMTSKCRAYPFNPEHEH